MNIGHYYQTFGQDCATICLKLLAKDFLLSASTDPTHISSQMIFTLHNYYSGFPTHLLMDSTVGWEPDYIITCTTNPFSKKICSGTP